MKKMRALDGARGLLTGYAVPQEKRPANAGVFFLAARALRLFSTASDVVGKNLRPLPVTHVQARSRPACPKM